MGLQRLTPNGLFKPAAYTQVIVASGRRMVFIAGQVSIGFSVANTTKGSGSWWVSLPIVT